MAWTMRQRLGVAIPCFLGMTVLDCTAHTTTATQQRVAPYSEIVREVQKQQDCDPTSIVFEVTEGPMKRDGLRIVQNDTSAPKTWRHVIAEKSQVSKIMQALQNVNYDAPSGDWAAKGKFYPMAYKLTLVYDYPYTRDKVAPPVCSITLDLSGAFSNVWDYRPLQEALRPYEPGFKAQLSVMKY